VGTVFAIGKKSPITGETLGDSCRIQGRIHENTKAFRNEALDNARIINRKRNIAGIGENSNPIAARYYAIVLENS
jgi:hypothetical protein